MATDFGKFLSEKRREANLTQKQLGEKLFLSESTISKWEKNKSNPDISVISDLANILNVSEHELITASVDNKERQTKSQARKWKILVSTWDLFFLISYSVALIVCFICNLAVDKTLSWFFIVLFALLLSASFTTIPKFIKKYKLALNSLIPLLSLIVLLGVVCIYTKQNWFMLAVVPIVTAFLIVFIPIYIKCYDSCSFLSRHSAIICVAISFILLTLMLFVINAMTKANWFFNFALPLMLFALFISVILTIILRYAKTSKLIKASIATFLFIPFIISGYFITKTLCLSEFYLEVTEITIPNLLDWSTSVMVSSNVFLLILVALLLISILLILIYLIKKKIKQR